MMRETKYLCMGLESKNLKDKMQNTEYNLYIFILKNFLKNKIEL